jgi:putative protease
MEEQVGKVIHFYDKISVAVVRLEAGLNVGDMIHVKGKAADFEQSVESMQVNHESVNSAKKEDEVAIKTGQKVKEGDVVYKK